MKKISDTIRIGIVRRRDVPPTTTEEQSQANNQALKKQRSQTISNPEMVARDHLPSQPYIPKFISPANVRLHDENEINTNKQQHPHNFHYPLSTSPVLSSKRSVDNLQEVPSKTQWWRKKKVALASTAAVIAAIIIVAIVLAVVFTRSADTTTTSTTTTTVAPTVVSAYWSFDGVTNGLYGVYNGSLNNGATFSPAGSTTIPYVGYGQALSLNSALSQSFTVSTPFLYLNSTSFTIEAWIYSTSLVGDRGIFGQCQCSTCANQCLYFICRANRLYVGFTSNDLFGTMNMGVNTWNHVAFVYNSQTQQQILYLNGVQDAIKSNAAAYVGQNGSIQIGVAQVYLSASYFNGYIDNVMVTTRAKSGDEVLRDASLIVYYPFDLPNPNADGGPNRLNGVSTNTVTTTGRVNYAMRLIGSGSYFQVYGVYQIPTGVTNNRPFSVSMWIYPTATTGSTFVQLVSSSPPPCMNLLGIYPSILGSTGQLFVQSVINGPAFITGPFVPQNTWTHVSVTYNSLSGYTLYFNGVLFGTNGNPTYSTSNAFTTLYIGYFSSCGTGGQNSAFQGSIDEVYVHNRELTQLEVTALANP